MKLVSLQEWEAGRDRSLLIGGVAMIESFMMNAINKREQGRKGSGTVLGADKLNMLISRREYLR